MVNDSLYDACMKLKSLNEYFKSSKRSPKEIITKAKEYEIDKIYH